MNFKLKNKVEITTGKRIYTFYNTVSPTINQLFLRRKKFTDYICFGSGTHTASNFDFLKSQIAGKKAILLAENYDIKKGDLFVSKYIELSEDEFNDIEICEIAFASNQYGFEIANYINTKNDGVGIYKTQNQTMVITMTIYLYPNLPLFARICDGENNLFKWMLGQEYPLAEKVYFFLANSADLNRHTMRRNVISRGKISADLKYNETNCEILSDVIDGENSNELVLMINDKPSLSNLAGVAEFRTTSIKKQFESGKCYIDGKYYAEAVTENGTESEFSREFFSGGITDCIKNPFDIIIEKDTSVITDANGKYFAINNTDRLDVYMQEKGEFKRLDFYSGIFNPAEIIKLNIDTSGNLYMCTSVLPYYIVCKNENGVLKRCTNLDTLDKKIVYENLSCYNGEVWGHRFSYYDGQKLVYSRHKKIITENDFTEEKYVVSTGEFKLFTDPLSGNSILYEISTDSLTVNIGGTYYSELKNIVKDTQSGVLNGNLFLHKRQNKFYLTNIVTGETINLFGNNIRKTFVDMKAKRIAYQYSDDSVKFLYFDEDLTSFAYDMPKIIAGEILDVKILGDFGVIVTAKQKEIDCYYLPLNKTVTKIKLPYNNNVIADISGTCIDFAKLKNIKYEISIG